MPGSHAELSEAAGAVGLWQAWARDVLRAHAFRNDRQRKVWGFYAIGWTLAEIETATKLERRRVTEAIEAVESTAPPSPCPNPWRKVGRETRSATVDNSTSLVDPRVTARLLSLAVEAAEPETLARLVASDETLNKLTGGASVAELVKRAVGEVRYVRIRLKKNETLRSPRNDKDLDVLLPVAFGGELVGRPHAGGIDLTAKVTMPGAEVVTSKVITVPWWKIDHAEKAGEGE